jgi:hypothetical protein
MADLQLFKRSLPPVIEYGASKILFPKEDGTHYAYKDKGHDMEELVVIAMQPSMAIELFRKMNQAGVGNMSIQQAIFHTNSFAGDYPEKHTELWHQFEKEVPQAQRSGYYGADNVAYVKWLKEKKDPVYMQFVQQGVLRTE